MRDRQSSGLRAIPRGVWALGLVSLLMDTSSEMIHSVLPVFLTSVLGASALSVGIIEGIAEATASVTKVFSGALSDRIGRRKPLVLLGYGLAALTKPVFALASTIGWVIGARFVDRLGKGIRGAPRDALLADLSPPDLLGASFGLRQSLDTVGAFAGPLIAVVVMALSGDSYRLVFWIATIPAVMTVLLILVGVREPAVHRQKSSRRLAWSDLGRFPPAFWTVVGVAMMMTLARFSEGFLLLRAQSLGLDAALIPLVLVAMNLVYAATSYPVGRLSDRIGRQGLLFVGFAMLIAADLVLAEAVGIPALMGGVALWGLHMGMTQGLLASIVADSTPPDLRGTGYGVFHLASGLSLLLASVIAGWVWTAVGPAATFMAGAGFTVLALAVWATLAPLVRPE
jgi:MFS family permease